jgi:hypothetical protein
MTVGLFFWLKTDKEGLASTSLCPVYWWERDKSWFVLPLLSGAMGQPEDHADHAAVPRVEG